MCFRFALVAFVLAGCAHFDPLPTNARPTAEQYPGAKSLILDDELEVRFGNDPVTGRLVIDETVHVRVLVLRPGGERVAKVSVAYKPMFSSVTAFHARTITAEGKERRFAVSDGVDHSLAGAAFFSDDRAIDVQLAPDAPGTVIEYRYTRRHHDWRLAIFSQRFDGVEPEQHVRLTVIAPTAWHIEATARRQGLPFEFVPTVSTAGRLTTSVWERRDVPAQPIEPFAPEPRQLATLVAVRLEHWTERGRDARAPGDLRGLSARLYSLTRAPALADEAPLELARSLVRDLPPDPSARARRLYAWVRDQISYCAIEIGLGDWQPHAAGDVFRHRYGDCKDKANLLREMFAAVGGASDLVVLWAHHGFPEPFDLFTRRANHVILELHLADGDRLVDPTAEVTPFDALPISDQDADYLPLTPTGAGLGHTAASLADDNGDDIELDLAARDGDLVGELRASSRGARADQLRAGLRSVRRDDQDKAIRQFLTLEGWHLESWRVDGAAAPEMATPVRVASTVRLPGAWPATASVYLLSAAKLFDSVVPSLPSPPREQPLVLPYRERMVARAHVAVDDSFTVALPPPISIRRPYGRYTLSWQRSNGKLTVTRDFTLEEHIFAASAYADVKAFFDEILAADAHALTIHPSQR